MKRTILIFITSVLSILSQAQIVDIPDANFKQSLIDQGIDISGDGEIQENEAETALILNVNAKSISSLVGIQSFINLTSIDCGNNQLINLDLSGLTNLQELSLENNQLVDLNLSGLTNLQELRLEQNQLVNLDLSELTSLEHLYCQENELMGLNVSGLVKLQTLICYNNKLTSLNISSLSVLFNLSCYNNSLTSLDATGLKKLTLLRCSGNLLETLNILGVSSQLILDCSENLLTNLELPVGSYDSIQFNCSYNQLVTLSLKNLEEVNRNYADFSNNPTLKYICVSGERNLLQVKNRVASYGYTDVVINDYCSFSLPNIVQGSIIFDNNGDGCDANDMSLGSQKINIKDDNFNGELNGTVISSLSGDYSVPLGRGRYTITPILETSNFTISPSELNINFYIETSPYNQDFCVTANGVHNDLEVFLIPVTRARPGFESKYKLVYRNKGNTTLSGNVSLTFEDDLMNLLSSVPSVTSSSVGNLIWSYDNLNPFEARSIGLNFVMNRPTDDPALNGGEILVFDVNIEPTLGDETPIDNNFQLAQEVVNSFDPNDKTCLEGTTIAEELIGEYVHYLIRFENKGSAEAVNIVVKDTIDLSRFDLSSLVATDASHNFFTRIRNGNTVEFIFEDINLPFDDATNDGYVAFKIKTLPTLQLGDTFENKAEIYFDFNAPITTNKYATKVGEIIMSLTPERLYNDAIQLYPNPVEGVLSVSSTLAINSIEFYNVNGGLLKQVSIIGTQTDTKLDVADLESGVYLVKVSTSEGSYMEKVVVE